VVDWAVAKFQAAGIEKVWTEPFTVPALWLAEWAEATEFHPQLSRSALPRRLSREGKQALIPFLKTL